MKGKQIYMGFNSKNAKVISLIRGRTMKLIENRYF